ncbi:ABC transporter permease [Parabacteroides sp. AM08-6]|uniref:ABC transporter permease n=1 Tax=Parabacteroides sp. AM08-6 TaxID=2292053 RepID=UPI000EFDF3CD|nr:ABC transporter permease [Parabacteroides sp. AM08-6]RHJ82912.1 ABC transporter permease [Parabacteroides sp. AM08-6]
MKTSNEIKAGLIDIATIIRNEFRTISGSYAILLVLTGGIFMYGLLYNYMYAPDVVRKVPVAVVDNSKSELSRSYIRLLDATPQVNILTTGVDYAEAQELMKKNEVAGILYLPENFEERVSRGEESVFIMYETTSAFLYYLAIQEASSGAMLALNENTRPDMLVFLPREDATKITSAQPFNVVGTALYNYTKGYGTYLIPAVLIVIMFQTLLMVIGMISGKERQTRSLSHFIHPTFGQMMRIVTGKTFVYGILYAIFALFLLGLIPLIFGLPDVGNPLYVIMLLIPFLLSTSFFGLTASIVFTDSDAPLLMIAFFSVGLIFLSGVSYPLELMPWYWKASHYIIPAAPATLAYVKLNSMHASMAEIHTEYVTLWIQCAIYFLTACWAYRYNVKKAKA